MEKSEQQPSKCEDMRHLDRKTWTFVWFVDKKL